MALFGFRKLLENFGSRRIFFGFRKRAIQSNSILFAKEIVLVTTKILLGRLHKKIYDSASLTRRLSSASDFDKARLLGNGMCFKPNCFSRSPS